jgi:hypothetical protein
MHDNKIYLKEIGVSTCKRRFNRNMWRTWKVKAEAELITRKAGIGWI